MPIVQAYVLAKQKQKARSKELWDVFDACLEHKKHLSLAHREQISSIRKQFRKFYFAPISEITTADIEQVFFALAASTRNRYLRTLNGIWEFTVRREWATENIITKLDRAHTEKGETLTSMNEQIQGMLEYALKYHKIMVPYFALGAFAGLRVGSPEMTRLLWGDN